MRVKNFTAIPVQKAEMIVPSLVPTIEKLKNIRDRIIERTTHIMSKAIFTFPKFLFVTSEIAFTNASPAFIITLAITERAMPNPSMIIPKTTMSNLIGYEFAGITDTHHNPKSVKYPNRKDNGICKS